MLQDNSNAKLGVPSPGFIVCVAIRLRIASAGGERESGYRLIQGNAKIALNSRIHQELFVG